MTLIDLVSNTFQCQYRFVIIYIASLVPLTDNVYYAGTSLQQIRANVSNEPPSKVAYIRL